MPSLHASPQELAFIREALRRHVPGREVWAFGSRIRKPNRPASDLDLVIRGEARVPIATMAALRHELEDSPLPFPVDIVEWAALKPAFRAIVEREHVVVQEGTA